MGGIHRRRATRLWEPARVSGAPSASLQPGKPLGTWGHLGPLHWPSPGPESRGPLGAWSQGAAWPLDPAGTGVKWEPGWVGAQGGWVPSWRCQELLERAARAASGLTSQEPTGSHLGLRELAWCRDRSALESTVKLGVTSLSLPATRVFPSKLVSWEWGRAGRIGGGGGGGLV